ncbi:MAG TPA: RagB/SusD family nutrient uptake outer membrane protein [Chitinophagaceae bacterium]
MKNILIAICFLISLPSCKKYLEKKPNQQWVIPATLQDAQALMDNYFSFNTNFSMRGLQADGDFYALDNYYNTLSTNSQDNYRWEKELYNDNEWTYMYRLALNSNIAMETVQKIIPAQSEVNMYREVLGAAHFHRANAFYHLLQYYAEPYEKSTAMQKPGIPLRLSSDINIPSTRATLENSWQQVIADLKQSAAMLPLTVSSLARPSRKAAYAVLARTFLAMEDYPQAGLYADSCLQFQNTLINYNTLNDAAANPFTQFSAEVIFSSVTIGLGLLTVTNGRCDSLLYGSYHANDLRRTCFFKSNGTNTWGFRGNYDGGTGSSFFCGPAVDEMYLVRAECFARAGNTTAAMNDLNALLLTRWKAGTFIPFTAATAEEALTKILIERRKELVARTTRWFDLRRLNKDPRYASTLVRKINGETYTLPPGDPRYTHYIPLDVIALTGMQQNSR